MRMNRWNRWGLRAVAAGAWLLLLADPAHAQRSAPVTPRQAARQVEFPRRDAPPAEPMPPEPPAQPHSAVGDGQPDATKGAAKTSSSNSNQTETLSDRDAERYLRRERRKSWTFRRYAGTIDMQQKVPYPELYHGQYYQRPWKPDWVHPIPPPPMRMDYGPIGRPETEWPTELAPPQVLEDAAPVVPGVVPGNAARKTKPRG